MMGGLNTYGYVGGNPVGFGDPLGLRKLTSGEKAIARSVFGNSINYESVDIHKSSIKLPDGAPAMAPFGNILVDPKYYVDDYATIDFSKGDQVDLLGLFFHEMTHVWQDHSGESMIWNVITERMYGYDYNLECGKDLSDYPFEQQGQIVMDYFFKTMGHSTGAFGSQSGDGTAYSKYKNALSNLKNNPTYRKSYYENIHSEPNDGF